MPLYPDQASNFAPQVDNLVLFMIAVCVFFAVAICAAVIYFIVKYQRRRPDDIGVPIHGDLRLEITWIVLPFFLLLAMFGWGAEMDVVPGHYNNMWFRPTKPGRYHFFCSQYCGTNHAVMGGWVTVMEPDDYAKWLSGDTGSGDPVATGEKLYTELACNTCHLPDGK